MEKKSIVLYNRPTREELTKLVESLPKFKVNGKKPVEVCSYCKTRQAFKTNSEGKWICKNRAYTGYCNGGMRKYAKPIVSNKVGRNQPCPCGSEKKFKHCHGKN